MGNKRQRNENQDDNDITATIKDGRYRIAFVCDFFYPRFGGVEMHIWSLSQHLIRQGHKVILITHAYGNRTGVRYMGPATNLLKVYYCPIIPMTDQDAMPSFTATLPVIRWILLREQIQIVHAHQATSVLANESVAYGSAMGLATVYTDHSLFGFNDVASVILNRVLQTSLSTVDAAICVSHTCRDNLILRAHLDPKRVTVIPNAVDPAKFTPDPSQRSKDRIKVVVVSRLVFRKGIDLLVGTIPRVCQELEQVDFIIAGDGNKLLDLKEMVERERLQDRVEFLGGVPHAQVRSVLVRGHIFLNCSLTESFCIAILEAACCGLLVVSTRVGGVPEVLPHDMVLLPQPNVPAIVEHVKLAVAKQAAVDPWHNHERLKQMYSWHWVAEQTVAVYDEISLRGERRSLWDRLACYGKLGGFAGFVAYVMGLTLELWLCLVSCWQPAELIDVVPDLNMTALTTSEKNKLQALSS
ncbi:Phosphatidylinositol N-acetylglucosaminyltransferase GPI3 subunit [Seminavis robusta]|uniref:phosphatidylinositol N-acetylglucosaminyltransferase n=1 Tax=Seminavis robusta TaxID=568900 RepID=A0A9N8E104_9STRA|nr:Phosphatidylinositol N-acetylglucosaminyltransferase GPI3 subunit [Seminavis robusta]|eukprot:Sro452_g145930.1 Phosphatidylinositol N-acetylglucosaminyltransferase GPI3 subunit (469) ;mRNA; r:43215-44808